MTPKPLCEGRATRHPHPFRGALARWFLHHGRDLPWRRSPDPYAVLVSEVMLQQTQVSTVLAGGHFERFLRCYPDFESLAAAEDDALLKAWEGLGYYRRARQLREAARAIIRDHQGRLPGDLDQLLALPGVGRYTAGAVRAFAFDLPSTLVDGNIARVVARLENIRHPVDSRDGQSALWKAAEALACPRRPRVHHSALMELGQRICRPGAPDCLACPVARWCSAKDPTRLPIKRAKASVTRVHEHALFVRDSRGRILLGQERGARRRGLWRLPLRPPGDLDGLVVIDSEGYHITRYKVVLQVHAPGAGVSRNPRPGPGEAWFTEEEAMALAMAAPFRRVLRRLLNMDDESV